MTEFIDGFISAFDGLQLYFRRYGERSDHPPVICLSGLTRSTKDFHGIAGHLVATGHQVFALDYRGRGRSEYDSNHNNYKPEIYVRDTLDFTAALGIRRAIFLGTSLGGLVTMGIGLARPPLIAGVILNDIGPELPASGTARIATYVGQRLSYATWDEAAAAQKDRYGVAYPDLSDEEWAVLARDTFAEAANGRIETDYDVGIAKNMTGAPLPDLWPMFSSLAHVPMLGIRGELSDILTSETFAKMAEAHPDFTSVTAPRVGHVPRLIEPNVIEAIDAFLMRCTADE
jgi:pimeloyl-ACP methyl ester carboxylesterase